MGCRISKPVAYQDVGTKGAPNSHVQHVKSKPAAGGKAPSGGEKKAGVEGSKSTEDVAKENPAEDERGRPEDSKAKEEGEKVQGEKEPLGKQLIGVLRAECLARGCGSIRGLGLVFRHLDIDYSRRIVYDELKDGLKSYGLRMSDNFLSALFKQFDKDDSGGIDFLEFMEELRPNVIQARLDVINEAFDKFDVGGDDALMMEDLKVVYAANARRHPRYLSGEWTEEETLRNFLDSLDTPGCPDGKVTRQEFLNYYSGVSATVDDDCYFDLMMRSCYNLPPRGANQ